MRNQQSTASSSMTVLGPASMDRRRPRLLPGTGRAVFTRWMAACGYALSAWLVSTPAAGADWAPTQPIKLIVPFATGGAGDLVARSISDRLAAALGQPVVVENRGGAGGVIGAEAAARALPDGHTLVLGSDANITIAPNLMSLRYDPVKNFEPVSLVVNMPLALLVNPQRVPARDIREFLDLVKSKPGQLSIASTGNGSSHHLAAELLKCEAKINLIHIPYKGQAAALTDLLGGQIDAVFSSPGLVADHLRSGRLKALAVSTSRRLPEWPDLPTLDEAGVRGYDLGIWVGLLYPAGTPKAAVARINQEVSRILQVPELRQRYTDLGYTPVGGEPTVLMQRIQRDSAVYRKLIQDAKISAN